MCAICNVATTLQSRFWKNASFLTLAMHFIENGNENHGPFFFFQTLDQRQCKPVPEIVFNQFRNFDMKLRTHRLECLKNRKDSEKWTWPSSGFRNLLISKTMQGQSRATDVRVLVRCQIFTQSFLVAYTLRCFNSHSFCLYKD